MWSWVEIKGANIATNSKKPSNSSPSWADLLRNRWRSASRPRLDGRKIAGPLIFPIALRASSPILNQASTQPDTWVQIGVRNINKQVHNDKDHSYYQCEA